MIVSTIKQFGFRLRADLEEIPFRHSANIQMKFEKDENYNDYTVVGYYIPPGQHEAKLLALDENGLFTLGPDCFKQRGTLSFSFNLINSQEEVHLGSIDFEVRYSFGDGDTILPEPEEVWISLVTQVAKDAIREDVELVKEKAIESSNNAKSALESANIAQQSALASSNSASNALSNADKAKEHSDSVTEKTNAFNTDYASKVEEFNTNVENANKTLEAKIEDVNFEIDKKIDKNLGEENSNKLLGTDEEGNIIVKDDIQLTAENISYKNSNVDLALDDVYEKLGDLMYIQISITSFTNNKNTVEMGVIVDTVVLNWNYNKVPKTLMLDNEILDVNLKTKTLSGQNINSNKTYTLKATDERNAVATKTTSITFLNGVYYGVGDDLVIDSITNQFILSLTKTLQSSKAKTFTVNAGESKHIYYAIPSRYGTPAFKVGGFEGGFGKIGTFNFTNASGYTETYDVYKSSNSNLGNTTVVVS